MYLKLRLHLRRKELSQYTNCTNPKYKCNNNHELLLELHNSAFGCILCKDKYGSNLKKIM